jgi:hypothetical protein
VAWVDLDGLRRRRGARQWLRDQGRAIQDAINGLGHMLVAPFSMDPANLPTFSQRNPGSGDLQRCIGRGEGFDPMVAFGDLANAGIGAGFAAFGGTLAEGAGEALSISDLTEGVATGLSKEAVRRMGHRGVSLLDLADAIANPVEIKRPRIDARGRWSQQYWGRSAVAVLNQNGRVVTCWSLVKK